MKRFIFVFVALTISVSAFCGPKKFVNRAYWAVSADDADLEQVKEHLDSAMNYEENLSEEKLWMAYGTYAFKKYESDPGAKVDGEPALVKAYEGFKKLSEIDERGKFEQKATVTTEVMYRTLVDIGVEGFNNENFEKALTGFEYAAKVSELPYLGIIDTGMIYNAGMAAYNIEKYDKAAEFLERSLKLGYEKMNSTLLLKESYLSQGDSAMAIKTLQKGYDMMPDKTELLIEMINFYLQTKKSEEALEYIDIAKEKEPENATLRFAEGTLYEQIEKPEKAKNAYEDALEIKPDYFEALFNMGIIHYNEAARLIEEAQDIPPSENEKYDAKIKEAKKEFKKALPHLEKAHEINDEDENVLVSLKEIYYRLRNDDPEYAEKLKEVEDKLKDE